MTGAEFSRLHSIYTEILQAELAVLPPMPQPVQELLNQAGAETASQPVPESVKPWLDLLDLIVTPHRLRVYSLENGLPEPSLLVLFRFLVGKDMHSQADREKVDWLATQFFKQREERTQQPTGWAKAELQEILKGIPLASPSSDAQSLLGEIPLLLDEVQEQKDFRGFLESRILQRGRTLKTRLQDDFFHPVILAAIVNYNLQVRKKFLELLEQSLPLARQADEPVSESARFDPHELLWGDYRTTSETLRHLSELAGKPASNQSPVMEFLPGSKDSVLEKELTRLGINTGEEAAMLKKWTESLAKRLRADPAIRSIRIRGDSLPLEEGESYAFGIFASETEPNLKKEFARSICHAVVIQLRIHEESFIYQKRKETSFQWKKHHNALLYLLCEGRGHKGSLLRLATVTRASGLDEMTQQLVSTANKLDSYLAQAEDILGQGMGVDAQGTSH